MILNLEICYLELKFQNYVFSICLELLVFGQKSSKGQVEENKLWKKDNLNSKDSE